jgi:hypothetical protein
MIAHVHSFPSFALAAWEDDMTAIPVNVPACGGDAVHLGRI